MRKIVIYNIILIPTHKQNYRHGRIEGGVSLFIRDNVLYTNRDELTVFNGNVESMLQYFVGIGQPYIKKRKKKKKKKKVT